jgi:eukaryotic-like serine/threonine-protein kinase
MHGKGVLVENVRTLGERYEVGALLGRGGMADVHVGVDARLSRQVAIKTLRSDLARDPGFQTRFRREAQAAAGLNHPNIVSVFDTGEETLPWGKVPYIVMEYVQGRTVRDLLRDGERISIDRALEIASSILSALDYSHRQGLIHRDIKPGNVMLTLDGTVKVMDFGIARALDDVNSTVTHTSSVLGTAAYLSPEQARGESVDGRSDLYAVGCLLYELLTGRPPFRGDTAVAVAYQHAREDAITPSSLVPEIPTSLDAVVMTALAKNPDNRYQTAHAMQEDLERVRSGERVAAAPLLDRTTRIQKSGSGDRNRWVNPVLIGLLITALALLGFFVGRNLLTPEGNTFISVPDVRGLTESEAISALQEFKVEVKKAPDPLIPNGRVSSQDPAARTRITPGSIVVITISEGVGKTSVPLGIIGKSLDEARAILQAAGLTISRTNAVDSDQATGTVVAVLPTMGSTVELGSGVVLDVASGNVVVPDVRGTSEIQARTILTQAGFAPQVIQAYDETKPVGVVLAQAPDPGTSRMIGSTVTITVNREPPEEEKEED